MLTCQLALFRAKIEIIEKVSLIIHLFPELCSVEEERVLTKKQLIHDNS
jgi:hypothetical protein